MLVIAEADVPGLVSIADAIACVEATFAALDRETAKNYPVVREVLGQADAVFGVKSGFDRSLGALGLKAGGYWPGNQAKGLTNHQSAVLLFDPESGRPAALIGGNYLTGARTGAASAIATKHLARPDARVLGVIGAGQQARYQITATRAVRSIGKIVAWDQASDQAARLKSWVEEQGLEFQAGASAEAVVRAADILITVTPAQQAIVMQGWVRPGTHINAMGADTRGKQELDTALVQASAIYVDSLAQSFEIGECQSAFRAGLIAENNIRGSLGGLCSGRIKGRSRAEEITLFDGTGVALQDLAVAALTLERARAKGVGASVNF